MEIGKLVELQINDLKTIDLVEMTMHDDGELVELIGDNGVGKSTVIEGIESLFNGGALPAGMIRNGKAEALVVGKFSEGYRVKRRIRKNKSGAQVASLEVFRPDGAKISAPQKVLKEVFESFSAPSAMANLDGVSLYNAVVPLLPIDVVKHEVGIEMAQRAVSEANAVVKAQGKKEPPSEEKPDIPEFDQDYYDNRADLLADMRGDVINADNKKDQQRRLQDQIKAAQLELQQLMTDIHELELNVVGIDDLEIEVAGMKDARDKRAHAEHLIHEWDVYEDWFEGLNSSAKIAFDAKTKLDELRKKKHEALAVAVAPGGVTVDEERNVFLDSVPWTNCAFSERLKAAILMQLAGIPEGKLKLVFIEHGESMNTAKRQEVARAAIEQGATVFMEIFNEDIKDLTIKSQVTVDKSWAAPAKKTVDKKGSEVAFEEPMANLPTANETPEHDFDDGLGLF